MVPPEVVGLYSPDNQLHHLRYIYVYMSLTIRGVLIGWQNNVKYCPMCHVWHVLYGIIKCVSVELTNITCVFLLFCHI